MRSSYNCRFALLLTAIIFFCSASASQAQNAKPKTTPKPTAVKPTVSTKPAPKSTPTPKTPIDQVTLSPLERDVLNEITSLRSNPLSYITYLEALKNSFKNNVMTLSTGEKIITTEGKLAIEDAIATLKVTKALPAFKVSTGLTRSAVDHLTDMVKNDKSGHRGSDGSLPTGRVERYGTWSLSVKENISYRMKSARDIVLNMLIDDGNPKREHRQNLLSSNLRYIGPSAGVSKSSGQLCVLVFAGDFSEKR